MRLQDIENGHLAFTNLADHLRLLITGPASVADVTYRELQCRFVERESVIDNRRCRNTFDSLNLNIWEDLGALLRSNTKIFDDCGKLANLKCVFLCCLFLFFLHLCHRKNTNQDL